MSAVAQSPAIVQYQIGAELATGVGLQPST
jgi:hypothetical protein